MPGIGTYSLCRKVLGGFKSGTAGPESTRFVSQCHESRTAPLPITQKIRSTTGLPLPNHKETGISPSWGRNRSGLLRFQNHKSLENGRFQITQEKRYTMKHTPFQPQPARYRPISQLGQAMDSDHTARKSQIVGIPPFPHLVLEAEKRRPPPFSPNPQDTGISPSWEQERKSDGYIRYCNKRRKKKSSSRKSPEEHRMSLNMRPKASRKSPEAPQPHILACSPEIFPIIRYMAASVSSPSFASTMLSQEMQNPGDQSLPGFQAVISRFTLQRAEPCQP